MKNSLLLSGLSIILSLEVVAQDMDLFNMSLEELMNVEIVSASKKEESTFDAPVSSSVITRDEIARSGVTTIPEALRLSPGLIVRETTNGNYDVFIRGFDNLHRYGSSTEQHNLYTLVMIDNRPVFNYLLGSTYWESLPVDLIDIDRIEIVRGPSAPLFGPNAVTGVINIITRHPQSDKVYASGNVQYGSPDTKIASAALEAKVGVHWSVGGSGNFQERARHDDQYYVYRTDEFLEGPNPATFADASELNEAYPDTELAMSRYGLNARVGYQANNQVYWELSAGLQDATTQRFNQSSSMPLTFSYGDSRYVNLTGNVHGVSTKISHNHGYDHVAYSSLYANAYDYDVTDIVLEYRWDVSSRLSL